MTDKPLLLAYLGDAVFELCLRRALLLKGDRPLQQLHREATNLSSAAGQAQALQLLEPYLTGEEADIVRRGRNTKSRVPHNADMGQYRQATGLEALFGYLYLQGKTQRIDQLFDMIMSERE